MSTQARDLPQIALSVRQPWAWAILHAGKDIENRTAQSVRAGNMTTGRVAIHAATGMTRDEYDWAVWRMGQDGVRVPRPDDLPRGAVIGAAEVVEFVTESASPWFGGPVGLVLRDPVATAPIPAKGARGYFEWVAEGALAAPLPWMGDWGGAEDGLFGDLPVVFETPPAKPWGKRQPRRVAK
ncbi:MAG: hypothetical protein AAF919_06900 [Pseudomonadota bacterium]